MKFIVSFLKGLCIGIGAITPGVSGGSLAVIFGLYERITGLIANVWREIRENFKENFVFFLPIALGGAVGVLGFSRVMGVLFENYNAQVKYLFIGLILGTFPAVARQANAKGFRRRYLFPLAAAFLLTLYLTALDNGAVSAVRRGNPGILLLMVYGAILGFGTIIPGVSASFVLMYLGAYETVLESISRLDLPLLIPMGAGFVLSIVIFAKFISFLFKKAYGYTYYTVLGFVAGSVIPIFPGFTFDVKHFVCVVLLIAGFALSYSLSVIHKGGKNEVAA
ncbi:MAG: DUF368 domain-containing protein [Clostridiales bacterium]|jgi:putative membrane protein|nr:DUF368 domain-containing protein [Clostridiales bacterium]